MSARNTLESATLDRKARLAQLKTLKRKAPASETALPESVEADIKVAPAESATTDDPTPSDATLYLSGRNYDISTRGPRLGFETAPSGDVDTVEQQATRLAQEEKAQREQDELEDKPLDLLKLQPKKLNWDLKRELDRRLEVANLRTENAIARIVKERVERQKEEMGGGELVSGVRALEEERVDNDDDEGL